MTKEIDDKLAAERAAGYEPLMVLFHDAGKVKGCRICRKHKGVQFGVGEIGQRDEATKQYVWTIATVCVLCRGSRTLMTSFLELILQLPRDGSARN